MIAELKPVRDIWKEKPSERHARIFLKEMIRPSGRRCPHCGSLTHPQSADALRKVAFWC